MTEDKWLRELRLSAHPDELSDEALDRARAAALALWVNTPWWRPLRRLRASMAARWTNRVIRERQRLRALREARELRQVLAWADGANTAQEIEVYGMGLDHRTPAERQASYDPGGYDPAEDVDEDLPF